MLLSKFTNFRYITLFSIDDFDRKLRDFLVRLVNARRAEWRTSLLSHGMPSVPPLIDARCTTAPPDSSAPGDGGLSSSTRLHFIVRIRICAARVSSPLLSSFFLSCNLFYKFDHSLILKLIRKLILKLVSIISWAWTGAPRGVESSRCPLRSRRADS